MGWIGLLLTIYTAAQFFGLAAERFGFWPVVGTIFIVLWILSRVAQRTA